MRLQSDVLEETFLLYTWANLGKLAILARFHPLRNFPAALMAEIHIIQKMQ